MPVAESRLCDLPFDVVEFTGEVDQIVVACRWWTEQCVRQRLRVYSAALRHSRDDRRRFGVVGQAEAWQHPLKGGGAQRIRGAVPGAPGTVQPAASFDRLRCAHHDRQPFSDERSEPSALPYREQRDRQTQLDGDPPHAQGE